MKHSLMHALTFVLLLGGSAFAQAPGDLGLFADPEGTQTTANPIAFTQQQLHLVAFDVPGNVNAWEANVGDIVTVAGATILGVQFTGPAPLNVGDNASGNFIVGAGGCVESVGATRLATITYLLFAPAAPDTPLCVRGSTPSSFPGSEPGYADCSSQIAPFSVATSGQSIYPDGCLILNPTDQAPISGERSSFGAVKARF